MNDKLLCQGVFPEVSVKGWSIKADWEHFSRQGKEDNRYQGPGRRPV